MTGSAAHPPIQNGLVSGLVAVIAAKVAFPLRAAKIAQLASALSRVDMCAVCVWRSTGVQITQFAAAQIYLYHENDAQTP